MQKVLDRAILGLLAAADGGCGNRTLLLQRGQQGFGLVGHLGKLRHELLMQPFKNLFGAEFRLTQPHDVSCQGVQRHIRNADPFAHAGSPPFYNNEFCVTFVPGWRQKNRPSRSCGARTACPAGRYPPRAGLFPAPPHGNPGWRREISPPGPGSPYN